MLKARPDLSVGVITFYAAQRDRLRALCVAQGILAGDHTKLTPTTQIDREATWADKYRDSDRNTTKVHYNKTHDWHFVDLVWVVVFSVVYVAALF